MTQQLWDEKSRQDGSTTNFNRKGYRRGSHLLGPKNQTPKEYDSNRSLSESGVGTALII